MKNLIFICLCFVSIDLYSQTLLPFFDAEGHYFFTDTGKEFTESNSFNLNVNKAIEYNGNLVLGGAFFAYNDELNISKLAIWDGTEMYPFPVELENISWVNDLEVIENELFICGQGTACIQKYNGITWEDIGSGYFQTVLEMMVYDEEIYAVGQTNIGFELARFNGGDWENIGGILNNNIMKTVVYEEEIYVCGDFTQDNLGNDIFRIAKLVGNEWQQVHFGLNNTAYDMEVFEGNLIIAGKFDHDGDEFEEIQYLAKWDGTFLYEMEEYSFMSGDTKYVNLIQTEIGLLAVPTGLEGGVASADSRLLILKNESDNFTEILEDFEVSDREIFDIVKFNDNYIAVGSMNLNTHLGQFKKIAYLDWNNKPTEKIDNDNLSFIGLPGTSLFRNSITNNSSFEVPLGSVKSTNYSSGLYLSALLDDEPYFAQGSYVPTLLVGPKANTYDLDYLKKYNRIWRVTSEEVNYHITHFSESDYLMPEAIFSWPAHGNVSNGESEFIASFIDTNDNGVYEPELGDYPDIRGDQCLFYILSDHRMELVNPKNYMDLEVLVYVYLYENESEIIENSIFTHYEVKNVSANSYEDMALGIYSDIDIGNPTDDYVGCDSSLNYFYGYNGDSTDEANSTSEGYGLTPPAHGVILLNRSMDGAISYNNSLSLSSGDPTQAQDYYNYTHNLWRDGHPIVPYGLGYPLEVSDTLTTTTFRFDAYPWTSGWCEPNVGISPADKRMLGNHMVGSFYPEENICFDVAFTTAFDLENPGPMESLMVLSESIQEVHDFYNNSGENCPFITNSVEELSIQNHAISIFPNPSNRLLNLRSDTKVESLEVYDSTGRLMFAKRNLNGQSSFDFGYFPSGIYLISAQINGVKQSITWMKD